MLNRLGFIGAVGVAAFTVRGLYAEELSVTPRSTEGPFYPDKMPLDTDNDLLLVNDGITPAVGEVTLLSGRVLTPWGEPVRNAFVEIWQCDSKGSSLHTRGVGKEVDTNFQGYGRFLTDSKGNYFFRTIKPVPYTLGGVGRAPHIHIAVSRNGRRLLTTQFGIRGHALNPKDIVFKELDSKALSALLITFPAAPGSRIGELTASFDLVLDRTAMEGDDGKLTGGLGPREFGGRRR
jgi:protocatechuate 3,4-dioxygenase, beta subunit